jgi:hypothetical protein
MLRIKTTAAYTATTGVDWAIFAHEEKFLSKQHVWGDGGCQIYENKKLKKDYNTKINIKK